uniref:Epidermal patterning factor-like protein n=1 Tax=Leersia perrieri TaxID=77586 RepID=A0A0D9XTL8_9ORYZ
MVVSCCCRSRISWRRRVAVFSFAVAVVFAAAAAGRPIHRVRRPATAAAHVTMRRLDSSSSPTTSSAWPAAGDVWRRRLIGPGSSPPTCRSRCGRCAPCRPVHVAIQPGVGTQWEYYPEVWRCKCGNKLFMP